MPSLKGALGLLSCSGAFAPLGFIDNGVADLFVVVREFVIGSFGFLQDLFGLAYRL